MRLLLSLLLLLPITVMAQDEVADSEAPAPVCQAEEYRQFDFWLGDWTVTANGEAAGTNRVHTVLNGCAIQENWQGAGAGGITGSSYNMFDQATGKWHQTWVDTAGTLLLLDGSLVNGVMVLSGRRPARDGEGMVSHRISWTPSADGSVRQLWEASRDEGGNWAVLFDGLYMKSNGN